MSKLCACMLNTPVWVLRSDSRAPDMGHGLHKGHVTPCTSPVCCTYLAALLPCAAGDCSSDIWL